MERLPFAPKALLLTALLGLAACAPHGAPKAMPDDAARDAVIRDLIDTIEG